MEILAYSQGVSVRRFAMEEVQPSTGVLYAEVTESLAERYAFQRMGLSTEAQAKGTMAPAYEAGVFSTQGTKYPIFGLEFSTDGFRAIAAKTSIADLFIKDLLGFVEKKFHYRVSNISKPALYASTLIVKADQPLQGGFGLNEKALSIIDATFARLQRRRQARYFGVKILAGDQDASLPDALFSFEKRATAEASEDVYFSQAPLSTEDHERYLTDLLAG